MGLGCWRSQRTPLRDNLISDLEVAQGRFGLTAFDILAALLLLHRLGTGNVEEGFEDLHLFLLKFLELVDALVGCFRVHSPS